MLPTLYINLIAIRINHIVHQRVPKIGSKWTKIDNFLLCNSTIIRKTFVFLHLMTHKIFLTLNPLIRKCLKLLQRNLFLWRRCNIILWKYSTEHWRQQRLITQAIKGFQCCQLWQFWNLGFFFVELATLHFFHFFLQKFPYNAIFKHRQSGDKRWKAQNYCSCRCHLD